MPMLTRALPGRFHPEALFRPTSLAVLGAQTPAGAQVMHNILAAGFKGAVLPVGIGIGIRAAKVIAAGMLLSMALDAIYADDPDYKKRDEMDRNTNYWFNIGGTQFRMPKGFEVGALSQMSALFAESFYDKQMTAGRVVKNWGSILANNLNLDPTPTALKPVVDVLLNKSSASGSPIVGRGMERLQPDQRYTINSSLAARGLSGAMNAALRLTPFNIDGLSPLQIDYMARAYTGWLGTTAMQMGDAVARSFTSEPARPAGDLLSTLTGGMASNTSRPSSLYVNMLYEQGDGIEKAYNTYREMIGRGAVADAQKFFAANKDTIQKHGVVSSLMRLEGNLNRQMRLIENNPTATPEQKKLQLMQLNAAKNRAAQQAFEVR